MTTETREIKLDDIIIDDINKRELRGVEALAESIADLGLLQEIGITEDNHLIFGRHRVEAYRQLSRETITARVFTYDDIDQQIATLAENIIRNDGKLLERSRRLKLYKQLYEVRNPETVAGKWARQDCNNYNLTTKTFCQDISDKTGVSLKTVYNELKPSALPEHLDALIEEAGLDDKLNDLLKLVKLNDQPALQKKLIKSVIDGKKGIAQADKLHHEQKNASQATGDGSAILTLGTCNDWLEGQPECDLLLTDPPYATDVEDIKAFSASWLPTALAKVKPTGQAYVCIGPYPDELVAYLTCDHGGMTLVQVLVWTYKNTMGPAPTAAYKNNWQAILYFRNKDASPLDIGIKTELFSVMEISAPTGSTGDRHHAWQKPDELAERLVRSSSKPGDLILDPFAGTGTFLMAARKLGRNGRGCDVSSDMLAIARDRGVTIEL